MGVDLQWESESGEVLARVPDERGLVARIIANISEEESRCLRFIDPYGDTVFNHRQIPVFLSEVRSIARDSLSVEARDHLQRIVALAAKAESRVHTYLKFYGD